MNFVAVMPSLSPSWTQTSVDSCDFPIEVIDNSEINLGIAASWNIGLDLMYERGADWLIIMSSSIVFGERRGMDLIELLTPERWIVETKYLAWHLMALNKRLFDRIGFFDENFFPAYYEDNDFGRRLLVSFPDFTDDQWLKPDLDVMLRETAHGLKQGLIGVNFVGEQNYYVSKWGGISGQETYDRPFGTEPIWFWPIPPDDRAFTRHQCHRPRPPRAPMRME